MKKIKCLIPILALTILASCNKDSETENIIVLNGFEIDTSGIQYATPEGYFETGEDADDLIENESFSKIINISFGTVVTIQNDYESEVSIDVSGNDVVVTALGSGYQYNITGSSEDGSLKIYSDKKFELVLNNLNLRSQKGAAINIQSKKRVFVVLPENTVNSLQDASAYTNLIDGEDQKAAFFAEGQLIFSGSGTLNVTGNYKHAICSDDYIRFREGSYNILKAATDGIHTNDKLIIDGGSFSIKAGSDGMEVEKGFLIINDGVFDINVTDDAIVASYDDDNTIDPYVVIHNGNFRIRTTEGEGIESKSVLTIHNGYFDVITYDDALNASDNIIINGGFHYYQSNSNDAIDSNGDLTFNGGVIVGISSGNAEGAFDNDNNSFRVNGGIIIGGGNRFSVPQTSSTQTVVLMQGGSASKDYAFIDNNEQILAVFRFPQTFSNVFFSHSGLNNAQSLHLYEGVTVQGAAVDYGIYTSGTVTGGSLLRTVSITGRIVNSSSSSQGGRP